MASYEIWLCDDRGRRLTSLAMAQEFSFTRVANNFGNVTLLLPSDFDKRLLNVDRIIEIWRAPAGGHMLLVWIGFLRKWTFAKNENGQELIQIGGPDIMELLNRRIVALASSIAGDADDVMKEIVLYTLGASAGAGRDLSSYGFSIADDLSLGPSISLDVSWKNTLACLKAIYDLAYKTDGTEVYFVLEPGFSSDGLLTMTFQTYIGQPGLDRTASGNVLIGAEWGNLWMPKVEKSYMDELTVVYSGGGSSEDATRSAASVWNRRESYMNAASGDTNEAAREVANMRPRYKFTGQIKETKFFRYGIDWNFGDRVACKYEDLEFDGVISSVQIGVSKDGEESIDGKIQVAV